MYGGAHVDCVSFLEDQRRFCNYIHVNVPSIQVQFDVHIGTCRCMD